MALMDNRQTPLGTGSSRVARPAGAANRSTNVTALATDVAMQEDRTDSISQEEACIHQLFEAQVKDTPYEVAIITANDSLTYDDLNRRANRFAHVLRSQGVGPEVRVGIYIGRSIEYVVAVLAVLKAGGAYVPLDDHYPLARLRFIQQDSSLHSIITTSELYESVKLSGINVIIDDDTPMGYDRSVETNLNLLTSSDSLAYVMYTSGSTGTPKGVMTTHRNVVRLVYRSTYAEIGSREIFLLLASTLFDASTYELWTPLLNGCRLVVAAASMPSVANIAELIRSHQVTTLWLTTALFQHVVDTDISLLNGIKQLGIGGEVVSVRHLMSALDALPNLHITNYYGPTETTTFATCHRIGSDLSVDAAVPIGRSINTTQVYVLSPSMQPEPTGVPGEIYIGGLGVARGYQNQPALTAERFIPDLLSDSVGARLYRTGDLGCWQENGELHFIGRQDDQVKLRGLRIELGEVAAAVMRHPAVASAHIEVLTLRRSTPDLVAYITPKDRGQVVPKPDSMNVRADVQEWLPDYMIPVAFVWLEELPRTSNGKIDKNALPRPDLQQSSIVTPSAPTNTEAVVRSVWEDVFERRHIGVYDDFLEIGGQSLLAMRIVARLRNLIGMDVAVHTILHERTIAGLAKLIDQEQSKIHPHKTSSIYDEWDAKQKSSYPLSFAQEGLWVIEQLIPGTPAYNISRAWRLEGALDRAALERALAVLIQRHEVLRTAICLSEDGRLLEQVISKHEHEWTLPTVDIRGVSTHITQQVAGAVLIAAASTAFDFGAGTLFRPLLLQIGEDDHILLIVCHHAIADGWSLNVLCMELSELYTSIVYKRDTSLPILPLQYGEYSNWQRERICEERLEGHLRYWIERLANVSEAPILPTDRERPAVQTFHGATLGFDLPTDLTEGLELIAREENATLFMVLVAAFQLFLSNCSGKTDVVIGSPVAGRTLIEFEPLIGFFVNTLVLRGDLSGDPTFRSLLKRTRTLVLEAFEHQDYPFERLVGSLSPNRSLAFNPIVQVTLAFHNMPTPTLRFVGLRSTPVDIEQRTALFDLSLHIHQVDNGRLRGEWEYNTDLFNSTTIERWADHWKLLLEKIVERGSQQTVSALIPSQFQQQDPNNPISIDEVAFQLLSASHDCVVDLIETQASLTPHAIAVVYGTQELTYQQLEKRSNQVAAVLKRHGAGPDVLVGLCAEGSTDLVIGLLGILKAGSAYVPLDPLYPVSRLDFMIADSRMPILLTQERFLDRLSSPNESFATFCLDRDLAMISHEPTGRVRREVNPSNLAYVIYTSGSTGCPKSVAVTHAGLLNHMTWMTSVFPTKPTNVFIQKTPIGFDASVWEFFAPLITGARLIIAPSNMRQDVPALMNLIREQGVDTFQVVPSLLRVILDGDFLVGTDQLRRVFCGGEPLSAALCTAFLKQSHAELCNLYGPTETTIDATYLICSPDCTNGRFVPIGGPISNTQLYVLGPEMEEIPLGAMGELYVGGSGLARGYLNHPGLTAERFVPDPYSRARGARLYRTGDIVRYAGETLEFIGRSDNQVKLNGFRIELGEIETILLSNPGVSEAVATVCGAEADNRRLVVYVVLHEGSAAALSSLYHSLALQLPEHMIPARIVELDSLPLLPNGKIDRKSLPDPWLVKAGDKPNTEVSMTAIERIIANIWTEILHVSSIGIDVNFFDAGGNSLLIILLHTRLKSILGRHIPIADLFAYPTVRTLARHLVSNDDHSLDAIMQEASERALLRGTSSRKHD
jgi:amino acid adenylation domain-containing protein